MWSPDKLERRSLEMQIKLGTKPAPRIELSYQPLPGEPLMASGFDMAEAWSHYTESEARARGKQRQFSAARRRNRARLDEDYRDMVRAWTAAKVVAA
jgi:hypothetical protein